MAQHVLGIDLGGTKVLAGVIDVASGKILSTAKKRSRAEHGPEDIVGRLLEAAEKAIKESDVKTKDLAGVGIGVAGQIDRDKGVIINAPNLAGMANMPLAKKVKDHLDLPVFLFNDVEAAAAGEATHGAGKGHKNFVVVFVGTGVGGSIYQDGERYTGATGTAGEIGHTVVDVNGRLCGCGGLGHLEAYASRTAIVRSILSQMHLGRESVLNKLAPNPNPADPGGSGIRSSALADALKEGDELTRQMLSLGADYLAAGLASVVNMYNPPLMILGGGLIESVDEFFQMASKRAHYNMLQVPRQDVKIVKAGLGDDSGIVGAAVLAGRKSGADSHSRHGNGRGANHPGH